MRLQLSFVIFLRLIIQKSENSFMKALADEPSFCCLSHSSVFEVYLIIKHSPVRRGAFKSAERGCGASHTLDGKSICLLLCIVVLLSCSQRSLLGNSDGRLMSLLYIPCSREVYLKCWS